jgi:hypothetical protein
MTSRRRIVRLLDRNALDGRTSVAKAYDHLAGSIHSDLGGIDRMSTIERHLVEAFVGSALVLENLNTRILGGAEIDGPLVAMHSAAVSAMVRVSSRLGIARRPRDVTPDPLTYAATVCGDDEGAGS